MRELGLRWPAALPGLKVGDDVETRIKAGPGIAGQVRLGAALWDQLVIGAAFSAMTLRDEAGYTIPETWDELLELTQLIADDGDPAAANPLERSGNRIAAVVAYFGDLATTMRELRDLRPREVDVLKRVTRDAPVVSLEAGGGSGKVIEGLAGG